MFLKRSGILFYSFENDCPENCGYRCRQKEPIIGTAGQFYHSLTISKHYSISLPQAFICNAAFSWSNPHFLSGFAPPFIRQRFLNLFLSPFLNRLSAAYSTVFLRHRFMLDNSCFCAFSKTGCSIGFLKNTFLPAFVDNHPRSRRFECNKRCSNLKRRTTARPLNGRMIKLEPQR